MPLEPRWLWAPANSSSRSNWKEAGAQGAGNSQSSAQPLPNEVERPSSTQAAEGRWFGGGRQGKHRQRCFPVPALGGCKPSEACGARRGASVAGFYGDPVLPLVPTPAPAASHWRLGAAVRAQGAEEAGALRGHRPRAAGVPPGAGRALGRFGEEWLPSSRRGALRALIWETTTSSYRGLFPAFGGLAPEPSCCLQCAQDQASVTACDPGTCTRFPPVVIGAGAGRGWVKAHWFPCVPLLPLHLGRPGSKEVRGQGGGERSGWR